MDICKHSEFCGGCTYQGVPYDEQLRIKEQEVLDLMKDIGIGSYLGIEGAPDVYRYRNKMEFTFGDMTKGGPMCLGMHQKGRFMSVVTADECQIVDRDFNILVKEVLGFAEDRGYDFYHKKRHEGLLRNLAVRKGERTKELLVNIVVTSQGEFDDEGFVELIDGLELDNEVIGILKTVNDSPSDTITPEQVHILKGRDYYMEKIMGLDFKVNAYSFFQTNIGAVERLYTDAIHMIDDYSNKVVFDLYCGTGTISQSVATEAKETLGIDISEDSISAAIENAKMNGLSNCRFIAGDVFKVLETIPDRPDCIIVDPPRAGIMRDALDKIADYGAENIVYISCNPKTMAVNLRDINSRYKVEKLKIYDNFPMTSHVETVVLLRGEKVDGHVEIDLDVDKPGRKSGTATYAEIKAYVEEKYGFKVSTLYIAQMKDKVGMEKRKNYNPGSGEGKVPICPPEKEAAIMDAFRHFNLI